MYRIIALVGLVLYVNQLNKGSSANRVGNFRDSEAIPVFDGNAIADW